MRAVLEANQIRDRKVYVADSFAGLPPPEPDKYPADAMDMHYTLREVAIPIEQVRENFSAYGLLDDQVVLFRASSRRRWQLSRHARLR
jgi:O-methyltransferase